MRRSDAYRLPPLLAVLILALGCPASRRMSVPPGEAAILSSSPVGGGQAGTGRPDPVGGLRKDGAACFSSAHCMSNICEGASCDASRPGTCVPQDRACTSDLVAYCGCDGKTFLASSSCPGEAFASRKACHGQERAEPIADGEDPDDAVEEDEDTDESEDTDD